MEKSSNSSKMKDSYEKKFLFVFIVIIALALFLRLYSLDARPMHFDEGTHWYSFVDKIYHGEKLIYYPDFHGFTSWYLSSIPVFFFGTSIFSLRLMVALSGVIVILLLYFLRKEIGYIGTLAAALFITVSPTISFFARMLNQYPYLVLFSTLCFVFLVFFYKTDKAKYLYLFSLSFGFLFTTHEISLIFMFIIGSFIIFLYFFKKLYPHNSYGMQKQYKSINLRTLTVCLIIFIFVVSLVMSSFFTNSASFKGFISQSTFQLEKSYATGHNKGSLYYLVTFLPLEIFAFLGVILSLFFPKKSLFSLFLFYWTFASFVIFSIMPYKVPWMFTLVLLPMCLLSGTTIDNISSMLLHKKAVKILFWIVISLLFLASFLTMLKLNYISLTSRASENPLNYVGPMDDNFRMIDQLYYYLGKDKNKDVLVVGDELWPLHYYLKDYNLSFASLDYSYNDNPEDYDFFIIPDKKSYIPCLFNLLGRYELRENYYIKLLSSTQKYNVACVQDVCYDIEIAKTKEELEQGLMYRQSLEEGKGMLFVFEKDFKPSFWMKNTLIPLDIIWIGSDKRIVDIKKDAKPCENGECSSLFPNANAQYVLEVNAGESEKNNFAVGDAVYIRYS
jgi:uncharacterized protein (TIGR03663 family)